MKVIKKNNRLIAISLVMVLFFIAELAYGQKPISLNAANIKAHSETVNRDASFQGEEIYLAKREGNGFLRIKGLNFNEGLIEADIKGSNTPQQSFVGIAFNGGDDETYEAIYFRPFNFNNPERKSHSVQYISHPTFTWEKLRNDSPGKYEAMLNLKVDPDDWFHVRIHVKPTTVDVYINNNKEPTLRVNRISPREAGWLGFWTGNFSDGWFKNLTIIK